MRYVQEPDAAIEPTETFPISQEDAANRAVASFETVFKHGSQIELDHSLVYFARKCLLLELRENKG